MMQAARSRAVEMRPGRRGPSGPGGALTSGTSLTVTRKKRP
jgi:hypothetical protein